MRRLLLRNRLYAITAVVAGAVTALALGGAMPAVSRVMPPRQPRPWHREPSAYSTATG